ncbi:type II secretion system protein J [Deinococcus sp. NW-56]|uniref:PulJ/GspJ family protein n=1 Tax=Deinococcus sp. NW-56 TaxID=2080419 RepID=UPI00131A47F3|nr:prepilin-type N-terminal cleavage/methylation domain-containing protein [Deinococcus sp. NW-56]
MRNQKEQGLTLIEVLVALSIFAIVSVAVLSMFPAIFKLNSQTRADQAVTIGAKQFMEQTRTNFSSAAGFTAGTLPSAPAAATVNNYTCEPSVGNQQSDAAGVVIIKRVTLKCTHTSQPEQTFVLDFGKPS